ncbi:spore gernimation protein GerA [Clostridium carboxidivorans P7]|uniref:GerA spore germination protein n=1 Tax=Clostridium carboxidivorans P7 TaxID=536227 RepID=C6PX11_9CLOT|nr:spore germination protein [Clostridium carboxidivorans]AKN30089.1 spore gernimation protein GerA [Clostridium carboxidivorans P7]EET86248.1 GerA spore germination protein [Clostridium carboxidivorans P7]EFG86435.1 putative spore germination protein KA [Clostridium carboxidivorans P7]
MKNKNSKITSILSKISYKKPKHDEQFYIPELIPEDDKQSAKKQYANGQKNDASKNDSSQNKNNEESGIPNNIDDNLKYMKKSFNYPLNKDIKIREFKIFGNIRAFIIYIDGMVDRNIVNRDILRPLLRNNSSINQEECTVENILNSVIETNEVEKVTNMEDAIYGVLLGDTGIYVDNCNYYIFCETKGYEKRAVDKPQVENVISGSQEAFNENLRTNTVLIRRIVRNNNLVTEFLKVGERINKPCAIMYINDLVNPALVKEVKRRISSINTDFITGDGMLEQLIETESKSLLPTILSTERPDRTAASLVEGKVAIISDGEPFALIIPVTVTEMLHSPEDMSVRPYYGTLLRFIRIFALFVATLLPGLYIAVTNFHQEMIPTELLIAIGTARENVPFPTILEVLLMETSFELIREAGVRVPGTLGTTIGIVGALILGQAAVQASLISPILIIIVAITGLGNFALPNIPFAFGIRIMRVMFIAAGATLGFYGISLLIVTLLILMMDMKSFGVPYMTLIEPKGRKSHDILRRRPVWQQEFRPDYTNPLDIRRQPEISRNWTTEKPEYSHKRGDSNE